MNRRSFFGVLAALAAMFGLKLPTALAGEKPVDWMWDGIKFIPVFGSRSNRFLKFKDRFIRPPLLSVEATADGRARVAITGQLCVQNGESIGDVVGQMLCYYRLQDGWQRDGVSVRTIAPLLCEFSIIDRERCVVQEKNE